MRTLAISATLILALSACGGGDDGDAEVSPASESPPVPEMGMLEACPQVEAALPANLNEGANADEVADPADMGSLLDLLQMLAATANLETKNAIGSLSTSAQAIQDGYNAGDEAALGKLQDPFYADLKSFADKCAAAGSSALG